MKRLRVDQLALSAKCLEGVVGNFESSRAESLEDQLSGSWDDFSCVVTWEREFNFDSSSSQARRNRGVWRPEGLKCLHDLVKAGL